MGIWKTAVPLMLYWSVNNAVVLVGMEFLPMQDIYWQTGVKMAGMFLGVLAVFPFYKKECEVLEKKNQEKKFGIRNIAGLFLTGSVLGVGLNFLFVISGFIQSSAAYQRVARSQYAVPLWLAILYYGVLSPVAEEIVFRGIIYRSIKRKTGYGIAIAGSALLFGGIHGNLVQAVYGGIMGAIFAVSYEKYGRILVPVLLHSSANIAVYLLSG